MAPISNIVPFSVHSFDPCTHLCRGDIVSAPYGLRVTFKWSNTNQTGCRHFHLPLLVVPNSPTLLGYFACSFAPTFVLPLSDGSHLS